MRLMLAMGLSVITWQIASGQIASGRIAATQWPLSGPPVPSHVILTPPQQSAFDQGFHTPPGVSQGSHLGVAGPDIHQPITHPPSQLGVGSVVHSVHGALPTMPGVANDPGARGPGRFGLGTHWVRQKTRSHAVIPGAMTRPAWKTPYAYGYFGADGKRHWTKSTGYRDRYLRWTKR